ncbi:6130_t:CDS:1, partial [Scutellospora calospora]
ANQTPQTPRQTIKANQKSKSIPENTRENEDTKRQKNQKKINTKLGIWSSKF